MCGIAGFLIFPKATKQFAKSTIINSMMQGIAFRGPDFRDVFVSQDESLALMQSRLSILDVENPQANQPFFWDERYALLFNGQIYNHQELRSRFLGARTFKTTSDTETLAYLLSDYGLNILPEIKGMFAFCLVDFLAQQIFLIRDRFGIKPLYFSVDQDALFFSSHLKSLAEASGKIISSDLAWFFSKQILAPPAPLTSFKDVWALPAGFYVKIDADGSATYKKWYDLASCVEKNLQDKILLEDLEISLKRSVYEHTASSDVDVSIFLSGGLDSNLILKNASFIRPITAFSAEFEGNEKSKIDCANAEKMAKKFGTKFCKIVINQKFYDAAAEQVLSMIDELAIDPVMIPLAILSLVASQNFGFKVALCGEGADEIYWGYDHYFKHQKIDSFTKILRSSTAPGKLRNFFAMLINNLSILPVKSLMFKNGLQAAARVICGKSSFVSGSLAFFENELKLPAVSHDEEAMIKLLFDVDTRSFDVLDYTTWVNAQEKDFLARYPNFLIPFYEFKHRLPQLLLMRADKASMMFGLETRVPFLDHLFVEKSLSFLLKNPQQKPKQHLKKIASRWLGSGFQCDQKIGFESPFLKEYLKKIDNIPNNYDSDLKKFAWLQYKSINNHF